MEIGDNIKLLSKNKPEPIPSEVLENNLNGFHWNLICNNVGVNIRNPINI